MSDLGRPRLLIIDDSSLDLRQWGRMFGECGYEVFTREAGDDFKSREDLCALLKELDPDCLLTDFDMQGINGFMVLSAAGATTPGLPIVMHSSRLPEVERYAGKSRKELAAPGFFLAVAEKGDIKGIDMAFKNHLQSAPRSTP